MPDELLMIMTSNGTLGDSGRPTGVWVEEVCVPLKAFRDAGFLVSAASPLGGRPPVDPRSAGFDTSTVPDLEALRERRIANSPPSTPLVLAAEAVAYDMDGEVTGGPAGAPESGTPA